MKRKPALWLMLLIIWFAVLGASPAKAIPITYDLTLTPLFGTTAGTGSFTIDGPIDPDIDSFSPGHGLLSLEFLIDGHVFSLANAIGTPFVTFGSGDLFNISYFGAAGTWKITLTTLGLGYAYIDFTNRGRDSSAGFISAAVVPVPGPMVGAGLPGLALAFGGFLMWWRRRSCRPLAA